jgi:tight adherence protein B
MNHTVVVTTLAVFLLVTLGLVGTYQACAWLFFADARRVRQRMAAEFRKDKEPAAQVPLYSDLANAELELTETAPDSDSAALPSQLTRLQRLESTLNQARMPFTARHFLILCASLAVASVLLAVWFAPLWIAALAGGIGAAGPFFLLYFKRKAQEELLLRQLPNAFELMARAIRSGQSVPQALASVAETFEDPIAREFASCRHQQNLGLRPEVTFQELVQRWSIPDLRIFAMAMMIQRQTGGNLSEVLERLSALMRSRQRLRQQVRAWTAEGRLQGWTLVALPFLMFGILMVINRKYVITLFDHVPLLVATIAFMILGILWIRKIVNFHY